MNNFDWNLFKNGEVVVHCSTKEKTNDFFKQCYDKDIEWNRGENLLNNNCWLHYEKDTCYEYDCGICYGNLECYKNEDYEIIEWETEKKQKSKCELHIVSDGIVTNCVYKLNGETVNKSSSKLNPIDKFNFKEGAKICIDRVFKNNIIKKGTKFRIINTSFHEDDWFVCLNAYIGQIGVFNYDSDLNNKLKMLSSGTFEKEYINAIDRENRQLIWNQSEVEILGD